MASILNPTVELRHLIYFRTVAEEASFTRAAAVIGLRQPTLSHQIKQLEQALGVELFHRSRRQCRLTAAGEMLLPYARRVLGEMDALKRSLDDLSGLKRGSFALGVLPALAPRVLPAVVARFHAEHPGIRMRVVELSMDDMERDLTQGKIEVGLGVVPPAQQSLRGEALFTEEILALVGARDPLARRPEVTVEALAERPLALPPPGYGTRLLILNAFARARRVPKIAFESTSLDLLPPIVRGGTQVALVPALALGGDTPEGCKVLRITKPAMKRQIGVLTLQGAPPRPAAQAFLPLLRRHAAEWRSRS
jgi:LysR family cyn operon transcriptional activator